MTVRTRADDAELDEASHEDGVDIRSASHALLRELAHVDGILAPSSIVPAMMRSAVPGGAVAELDRMALDDVVYVDTQRGAELFDEAHVKGHFWTLCRYFISENFLTYCGIASSVMVLNSLGVDAPDDPQIYPYKMFKQENIFTDEVLHHRRPLEIEKGGNTLEQLATIFDALHVGVEVYFGSDLDVDGCRGKLIEVLEAADQRVIVDFHRKTLKQKGGGHFSPLAAYHEGEDRFLLMDVARYKLPPYWVKASALHEALVGVDTTSGKSRGFLVVTRPAKPAAALTS